MHHKETATPPETPKAGTGKGRKFMLAAAAALLIAMPAPAEAAGSGPDKPYTARIDAYMEEVMSRLHIPGAALGS